MRVKLMMQTEGIIQLLTGFCHFSMRLSSFCGLVLSIFNESNSTLLTFCCCPKSSRNVYLHIFHCWMWQFWHNLVNEIEIILLLNCKGSQSRAKNEENVVNWTCCLQYFGFCYKVIIQASIADSLKAPPRWLTGLGDWLGTQEISECPGACLQPHQEQEQVDDEYCRQTCLRSS